ncbi:MAG: polyprenol monophosphomannose synthase [Candidatus Eisenbacteria sp.]|nr:polyprenol monophosphomannose synthase [Candidatus Eisenbacteria bacterium]
MKTVIVIPTYNERENISRLIPEVLSAGDGIEVLVVDDNSPDGTGDLVDRMRDGDSRIHVLHRPGKMGLGSAYVDGFRIALDLGAELVFEMDADFSHDPKYIPEFLRKIGQYDVVLGSRYLDGVNVVNWPLSRLILSVGANVYSRIVTGVPIRDLTGGFKCFRRKVLESVEFADMKSDGYAFQIEVNFKCWRAGFRLCEIPIVFVDRHAGTSKMSKRIIGEAAWMVWRLRLGDIISRLKRKH